MPDRKKVLLAYPTMGWSPPECSTFREQLAYQLGKWEREPACPFEFEFGQVSDTQVGMARNYIASAALDAGFDYVGMIDDDMIGYVTEGGYDNVWYRLLSHDVDIVAALAFMRAEPHYPVCYATRGGWNEIAGREDVHNENILNYPKGKLFECDAVGFGAVLIKMDVFKRIKRPWFTFAPNTGEDIQLCIKAKQAGFRVFMDSAAKLKHLAPRTYLGEEEFEATNGQIAALRKHVGDWTPERARENLPA